MSERILTAEEARALYAKLPRMGAAEKLETLEMLERSESFKKVRAARGDMIEFAKHVYPGDRKSTRLNSSHSQQSRMPSSA